MATPFLLLRPAASMLDLRQPGIMGILNITPDSFSDGGSLFRGQVLLDAVLQRAEQMLEEGAAVLDIGGESTRPGAEPVSEQEELERVMPVVEALHSRFDCPLSVDTSSPALMRAALAAGVAMINDVRALQRPDALAAVSAGSAQLCLMHMSAEPGVMQQHTQYQDVVSEVIAFLQARAELCRGAGIDKQRICLDPGFGFGKTLQQNLQLLTRLPELVALGYPVLVGLSRKSLIGTLTGRAVDQRMPGSISLGLLALQGGATILRVHDVGPTRDMLRVWQAFNQERNQA